MGISKKGGKSFSNSFTPSDISASDSLLLRSSVESPIIHVVGNSQIFRVPAPVSASELDAVDIIPVSIIHAHSRHAPPGAVPVVHQSEDPVLKNLRQELKPFLDYILLFNRAITEGEPVASIPAVKTLLEDFIAGKTQQKSIDELRGIFRKIIANEIKPSRFDPVDLRFEEAVHVMNVCGFHARLAKDTILRYSMNVAGIVCADNDVMLAVYLYFEEKFGVKVDLKLCVRYKVGKRTLIGVLLDSIRTQEEIMRKAKFQVHSRIQVMKNRNLGWILDGWKKN